ncbi:hypothetical protein SCLCIDRAFT_31753 [Scleroderma citrinum Foug A]|uniref:Uncharacterized protein n=1 Tax=Scleroderma citrinum Foug A TaxID=1036808 RepID=A0A0C2YVI5_9AGAM|nr:hypothetical protein SCLCIDRAFT_31753 [Scleroderma citrinum Foug A]
MPPTSWEGASVLQLSGTRSAQQQVGNSDDERINAVHGMSFAEMQDFFKNLKD